MAIHHHDMGYKELFSHPEFVQQLMEGFAPSEVAGLMDFTTLKKTQRPLHHAAVRGKNRRRGVVGGNRLARHDAAVVSIHSLGVSISG